MSKELTASEVIEIYTQALSQTAMDYGIFSHKYLLNVQMLAMAGIMDASKKKGNKAASA